MSFGWIVYSLALILLYTPNANTIRIGCCAGSFHFRRAHIQNYTDVFNNAHCCWLLLLPPLFLNEKKLWFYRTVKSKYTFFFGNHTLSLLFSHSRCLSVLRTYYMLFVSSLLLLLLPSQFYTCGEYFCMWLIINIYIYIRKYILLLLLLFLYEVAHSIFS